MVRNRSLACCVPYLQLHALAVELDGSDFEVPEFCQSFVMKDGVNESSLKAQQQQRLALLRVAIRSS